MSDAVSIVVEAMVMLTMMTMDIMTMMTTDIITPSHSKHVICITYTLGCNVTPLGQAHGHIAAANPQKPVRCEVGGVRFEMYYTKISFLPRIAAASVNCTMQKQLHTSPKALS